jgi:hypothetical protein
MRKLNEEIASIEWDKVLCISRAKFLESNSEVIHHEVFEWFSELKNSMKENSEVDECLWIFLVVFLLYNP